MVDAKGKPSYVEGVGVLATEETLGYARTRSSSSPGLATATPLEANASYQVQGRTTQRYKCFLILCNCYIQYKTLNDIFPV